MTPRHLILVAIGCFGAQTPQHIARLAGLRITETRRLLTVLILDGALTRRAGRYVVTSR